MEEPVLPAAIVPAARVHSCVHACTRVCMHAQLYTPAHASNRLRICRRHGRQSAHGACGHACAHNCGHAMCVLARAMVVCRLTMSRRSRRTCPCHGACRPGRGDAQRGVRTCMPCGRVGLEARQVPPAARPGTSRHVTSRHVTASSPVLNLRVDHLRVDHHGPALTRHARVREGSVGECLPAL